MCSHEYASMCSHEYASMCSHEYASKKNSPPAVLGLGHSKPGKNNTFPFDCLKMNLNNVRNVLSSEANLDAVEHAFRRKFLEKVSKESIIQTVAAGIKTEVNYAVQRIAVGDNWTGFGGLRASYFQNLAADSLLLAQHYFFNFSFPVDHDEATLSISLLDTLLFLYTTTNTNEGSAEFSAALA
eukprot:scaffold1507_cov158-Ochromonas_danica.AAC.35